MSHLTLRMLGTPLIELDRAPVRVDTRKAVALLAYLAVTRQPQSRDVLASLLWYDYDEPNARAALRRTLSALKGTIGGDWLNVDRQTVCLRAGPDLEIDVDRFQACLVQSRAHAHGSGEACAACLQVLSEAVELYRDDFLAGFAIRDSPPFDEWQLVQTEGLRRELAGALEHLAHGYAARSHHDTAIGYARRWLALDPLHEPAHRLLMQLYSSAGQRSAALRQYRECVRILDEELAVPPLDETTSLYQAIKEIRQPAAPAPAGRTTGRGAHQEVNISHLQGHAHPLVGRTDEWTTLLDRYRSIRENGHVVVLEGEAGIGKTRLAEEFLRYVDSLGAATLTARCYEGESDLTYAPIIELLRSAFAQVQRAATWEKVPSPTLGEVVRLLPHLGEGRTDLPDSPALDSPGAHSRFLDGIVRTLTTLLEGPSAGVLFVDDLQWADAASLELLAYLARRLSGSPICLLLAWRPEDLGPADRIERVLTGARRAGVATAISLPRLDRASVLQVLQQSVPGQDALALRLYEETEGLPLFLVEYLSAVQDAGADRAESWPLPSGVRDLLRSRLKHVSEAGRQLLSVGAIIGRSFDLETVRSASGRDEELTVSALEDLVARRLVRERHDDMTVTYDFTHQKLRTLVYEETSLARRRLLHRRVAEALALRARDPRYANQLAGTIAQHYRMAGQESEAASYFRRAGDFARSLYANREALSHFQASLALGYPDAAGLHLTMGELHTVLGGYTAAIRELEAAAATCHGSELAAIEHRLGGVHARRGEWELAASYYESALGALGDDGAATQRIALYADWSLAAQRLGDPERAQDLANRALDLAQSVNDIPGLAQAHNVLGILSRAQEDHEMARWHFERSLSLSEELGDPGARAAALNNLALAYGAEGDTERARDLIHRALALCTEVGDRHHEAALHNNLADLLQRDGAREEAIAEVKQAVAIYADIGAEGGDFQPEIWKLTEW